MSGDDQYVKIYIFPALCKVHMFKIANLDLMKVRVHVNAKTAVVMDSGSIFFNSRRPHSIHHGINIAHRLAHNAL